MNTDDHGLPSSKRVLRSKPNQPRHPLDVDARRFDFAAVTMDLRAFRRAFALGAFSMVWGCNWDRVPLGVGWLSREVCAKAKPDTLVTITAALGAKREQIRNRFFGEGDDEPPLDPKLPYRKSWREVQDGFRRLLRGSYMQAIADASARCAVGGAPGTYSDYDSKGSPPLAHIPLGADYYVAAAEIAQLAAKGDRVQDFRWLLQFYARCLGVVFHAEGTHPSFGRGFATYQPNL